VLTGNALSPKHSSAGTNLLPCLLPIVLRETSHHLSEYDCLERMHILCTLDTSFVCSVVFIKANGVCCVRVGPLGSRLRLVNFMRHLHRQAAFFAGGLRDDCYLHFGSIIFEIGVRECCQLVNKSLRSDWDSYPHSFLLYHEGHIQVTDTDDHVSTQSCTHSWLKSSAKLPFALVQK
jgi:hypothetical protein